MLLIGNINDYDDDKIMDNFDVWARYTICNFAVSSGQFIIFSYFDMFPMNYNGWFVAYFHKMYGWHLVRATSLGMA